MDLPSDGDITNIIRHREEIFYESGLKQSAASKWTKHVCRYLLAGPSGTIGASSAAEPRVTIGLWRACVSSSSISTSIPKELGNKIGDQKLRHVGQSNTCVWCWLNALVQTSACRTDPSASQLLHHREASCQSRFHNCQIHRILAY